MYSFFLPPPPSSLPINKLGLLAWVHTFHLAIACVRLGGSLNPPSCSYLKIAKLGGFLLWVSVLSPQFFHLVCPLPPKGFVPSLIISGCIRQPPEFLLWGLCPLTAPLSHCAWGSCPLTAPLCSQGVSANHPSIDQGVLLPPTLVAIPGSTQCP